MTQHCLDSRPRRGPDRWTVCAARGLGLSILLSLAPMLAAPCTADAQEAAAPSADADAEAKRLFQEGKRALDAGAYAEAAELFQRAYALSGRPSLLYNQAVALHKGGRSRDALLLARDARTQMPEEKLAHLDALIAELESVVTEDKAAREYFQLAQTRMQQGLYAEAAIGFHEAYKLSGHPEMLLNQARALEKAGDIAGALSVTTKVLQSLPANNPLRITASLLRARLESELAVESKRRGRVRIITDPPDALVHVDGTLLGRGEDNIAAGVVSTGPHQLDVSRQGFVSVTRGIDVQGAATLEQTITLSYAACEQPGQRRVKDAPEFCCWPGQTVSQGACTGTPSCPPDLEIAGDTCVAPRPVQQAATATEPAPAAPPPPPPSKPALHSVNLDLVLLPLGSIMKGNPLNEDWNAGLAHSFRAGYRALPLLSLELGYSYAFAANRIVESVHATYLLVGLHRARKRQRGTRDLFLRSGVIPYFRSVSLERTNVIYERTGWGLPFSVGVNGMRGTNFGVGFELHAEWIKVGEVCEHGFGRGCIAGGTMIRLGAGLSFLWSAP